MLGPRSGPFSGSQAEKRNVRGPATFDTKEKASDIYNPTHLVIADWVQQT